MNAVDVVIFSSAVVTASFGLMVLAIVVVAAFFEFDWRKHNGKKNEN